MAIFLTKDSKVIVQGITGGEGTKHTALMLKAGTQVVGGVNARKAGTTVSHTDKDGNAVELPVFATVAEAMKETGADVSIAFVPRPSRRTPSSRHRREIPLLVVITEGIPVQDSAYAWAYNVEKGNKTRIIGPNCRASSPRRRPSSASPRRTSRQGSGRPGLQVRHLTYNDVRAA